MRPLRFWLLISLLAGLLFGCQEPSPPFTTAVPPATLPASMKGYELYSWQAGGDWFFTLITGTNRQKNFSEIGTGNAYQVDDDWVKITVKGESDFLKLISTMPVGEYLIWSNHLAGEDASGSQLSLPGAATIEAVKRLVEARGLNLTLPLTQGS